MWVLLWIVVLAGAALSVRATLRSNAPIWAKGALIVCACSTPVPLLPYRYPDWFFIGYFIVLVVALGVLVLVHRRSQPNDS